MIWIALGIGIALGALAGAVALFALAAIGDEKEERRRRRDAGLD